MRRLLLLVLALPAASLPACRRIAPRAIEGVEAMRGVEAFRPPADGELTDAMIDRYLQARRQDREERPGSSPGPDRGELDWTRSRIVEALAALDARRVRDPAIEAYSRAIGALREARRSASVPGDGARIDSEIASLERERSQLRRPSAVPVPVLRNAARIAPRRAEIEAVGP